MSGSGTIPPTSGPLDDSSSPQTSSTVSQYSLFTPSFSITERPPYCHELISNMPDTITPDLFSYSQHSSIPPVSLPKPPSSQVIRPIPSTVGSTSHAVRRPARPITKCDRCRGRKSKCDSVQPCGPCQRSKAICLYTDGRPTKGIQENITSSIPQTHRPNQPITTISLREEHNTLINKLDTLQKLLNDVTVRQALQAREINISLSNQLPANDYVSGIDLESDNLVTHFSKLWLRKEPDQSFFQATHPDLVKLRQDQIPRWQKSRRWKTWVDYQEKSKYQQLTRFDPSLLPEESECRDLLRRFILSCDWYFEVLTETEANLAEAEVHHYRSLGLTPTSPEQWTRIALSLAVCRLTLACLDWAGTDESEQLSRKRCERILNWCDLAVMALQRAGFDQNPTVEAMRVLIILTSTIFFETDYGLMGSSPQMLKLHEVAVDVSERLNLHRDPPAHLSSKEKDDRRRMWWALVTIDSHFCATGATSNGVLRLQNSNTKLPVARNVPSSHAYADESLAPLDLRSARSRFELGKLNNRCCQLLAQRKPLATLSDIWRLDQDLVALEARVPDEQRLSSNLDLAIISQRPVHPSGPIDDALRNGQQIFYIGLWHIRSKVHRGLLYKKPTSSDKACRSNVDAHRDIVRRCSGCLLHLYRHTKLPTAFISAIASAALTLSLELINQPLQPYNREIRTIVIECFSRLQTNSSPIIGRACQVLEYFLGPVLPHTGIPRSYAAGFKEWQDLDPCAIISEDSTESTSNFYPQSVNGLPENRVKGPVQGEKRLITDGSSVFPVTSVEEERIFAPNHAHFDAWNQQPMIRSTNPLLQMKSHDLLIFGDEGRIFQQQDTLQEPWIEQSQRFELNDYSIDMRDQSKSIETPPFQSRSSSCSNYLPLMTPIGGYATLEPMPPVPTIPNSTIYSNDGKGELYSPIGPSKMIQTRGSWPDRSCEEELYYYGSSNNIPGGVSENEILNHSGSFNHLDSLPVNLNEESHGPLMNRNFSINETSSNFHNHRIT